MSDLVEKSESEIAEAVKDCTETSPEAAIVEEVRDEGVPDHDVVARANTLKDEGNALLGQCKYAKAAEKYTEALSLHKTAIFYSNRAQALIKLESFGTAILDANEALKLDPSYIKAYYRRGSANYALGKLKLALKDFKAVVKLVPKDPDALRKFKACDKAVKEEAFQKAIESEAPPEESVDADSIVVEASYSGPHLPMRRIVAESSGGGNKDSESFEIDVTKEFVQESMDYFKNQKLLHRKYVLQILLKAINLFKSQPSLLRLNLPREGDATSVGDRKSSDVGGSFGTFTVCGDTHGQYYDLCNLFEMAGGLPSDSSRFLFNGDFVDRGSFSFETVFTLIMLKLHNPNSLHMLRGNHETKNMNKIYGFTGEIKHKYDDTVMNLFSKLFQWLPLAAVIEDKVFVVHGGLSTQDDGNVPLSAIEALPRNREPPESGLMSDLLWSDPQLMPGRSPSKRGLGFSFGPDYTERFLSLNKLQLVIRSHEVKDEGYVVEHNGKCVTVFSAPNYCDQMGNKAAFVRFVDAEMKPSFTKFEAVPHPNIPPMRYAGNMFSL